MEKRENGGVWIVVPAPAHTCDKPSALSAMAGSIWRCNCGVAWRVTAGDQRDPGNFWMRSPLDDVLKDGV